MHSFRSGIHPSSERSIHSHGDAQMTMEAFTSWCPECGYILGLFIPGMICPGCDTPLV